MRIGIIGAGQLGQMLGFAARDLGMQCHFVDPSDDPPAAVAGPVIQAEYDDPAALDRLVENSDIITYEFENVPIDALRHIGDRVPVYPPPAALRHAQDRLAEKRLFETLNIPLPAYHAVDSLADLQAAAATIGLPLVLKTRRFGYDGKGQVVVRQGEDLDAAWAKLGATPLIAEAWVSFDSEVSAIGARNVAGDVMHYPLTLNQHVGGILHTSRAPVVDAPLTAQAQRFVANLLQHLEYVGVLALEFFVVGEQLLANEFAPRVHNSGHWSIEGAVPSQFTAHLLAISNGQLAAPELNGHAGMLNLIGSIPDAIRRQAAGTLHDYGKQPRPGRKLGHITVIADSGADRDRQLAAILQNVT